MPSKTSDMAVSSKGLPSFLGSLKTDTVEASVERLISLLASRQIRNSKPCAIATTHLLLQIVEAFKWTGVSDLILQVRKVGKRLCNAQPREMVVGNIVRRVLGIIREEVENDQDADVSAHSEAGSGVESRSPKLFGDITSSLPRRLTDPSLASKSDIDSDTENGPPMKPFQGQGAHRPPPPSSYPSTISSATTPMLASMFNLLSQSTTPSGASTPGGPTSPARGQALTASDLSQIPAAPGRDLKGDIVSDIVQLIDELGQASDQIANYALDHIHADEVVLTATSSRTVQKFLLKAAAKRKFTVIHAESYPNNHEPTYSLLSGHAKSKAEAMNEEDEDMLMESFTKPLITAGITVIIIPDSAVFALMSRVNKVILGTYSVLANGGLIAAAGARAIATAAETHRIPVVVLSGVYKLSPVYPFDFQALIEYGNPNKVMTYAEGTEILEHVEVENPIFDYVPADLVNLYITNLGGHAPSYLYRIVSDHYHTDDIALW